MVRFRALAEGRWSSLAEERTAMDPLLRDGRGHLGEMSSPLNIV